MEVIDGFSRWRGSSVNLRHGGCSLPSAKEKRTGPDSPAFQAGMQELEEGFAGDKSKKIV